MTLQAAFNTGQKVNETKQVVQTLVEKQVALGAKVTNLQDTLNEIILLLRVRQPALPPIDKKA